MQTEADILHLRPDWDARLSPGDVVAFRFPHERARGTGPVEIDAIPCLVIAVLEGGEDRFLELVGGLPLSAGIGTNFDIVLKSAGARAAAGVRSGWKFVSSRRVIVSTRHAGFVPEPSTGSPVLGRLDAAGYKRLERLRSLLDAVWMTRHGRTWRDRADVLGTGSGVSK